MFESELLKACENAWQYLGNAVSSESKFNESDFKHELYHQLAQLTVDNVKLNDMVPGTSSCRLHAETKIESGENSAKADRRRNSAKADLSICDPTQHMKFNYQVLHVLELKLQLNSPGVKTEMTKLGNYANPNRDFYLISALPCKAELAELASEMSPDGANVHVYAPRSSMYQAPDHDETVPPVDWDQVHRIVQTNLDEVLELYGRGRTQYHGFYWCNYEQEQSKGQTYPCESDFTCQLYHRLRNDLPENARIQTEYTVGTKMRIDLIITDGTTALPIEVKMNWDQFEHKRDGVEMREKEASTINSRFSLLQRKFESVVHRKVVIIQYDLRQRPKRSKRRDRREEALSVFSSSPNPVELVAYSECDERVVRLTLGG
jgi:hypothetical protein